MATAELDLVRVRDVAVAVAYRMVGSRTDAEDLAQETIVRVQAVAERDELRSPEAFATTVATRLAIDHLRSARVRREAYLGPWLPEPVLDESVADPGRAAELADSLSFAFLVVLESLGPVERAAFLLHDVFGFGYPELVKTLGRTEPACRQLVARARRRVAEGRPRHAVDRHEHRRVLERFVAAAQTGDVDGLVEVLAEDVVLVSDGGPARKAARDPVVGRHRVTRFLRTVGPHTLGAGQLDLVTLNGERGFVVRVDDRAQLAGTIEVHGGRVHAVNWVLNPDKLRWIDDPERVRPRP